jgi:hypothetical protein
LAGLRNDRNAALQATYLPMTAGLQFYNTNANALGNLAQMQMAAQQANSGLGSGLLSGIMSGLSSFGAFGGA